jgi:hypothetical protein
MGHQAVPVLPTGERISYYLTGRVSPEYREWARGDLVSPAWMRREWIRFVVLSLTIWGLGVMSGAPPFRLSFLVWVGAVALVFLATAPLRRKMALDRINERPLPQPTPTGMATRRPASREPEETPDPMQSFYAKLGGA